MKARVKATGEIIEVELNHIGCTPVYMDKDGVIYKGLYDLDFEVEEKSFPKEEPDYWDKLRHHYAGMFLQGMIIGKPFTRDYVEDAYQYATALINRLKEESQCEK